MLTASQAAPAIRPERAAPFEIWFNHKTRKWLLVDVAPGSEPAPTYSEHETLADATRQRNLLCRMLERSMLRPEAVQ